MILMRENRMIKPPLSAILRSGRSISRAVPVGLLLFPAVNLFAGNSESDDLDRQTLIRQGFTGKVESTLEADLDGSVASYLWDFGDGTTSTAPNPQHTYNTAGKYVATLKVTDNAGATTTNTVALEITAPNLNPVAKFTFTPQTGHAPLSITLSSDGSYNPDGAIGNREWHFSDGGTYFGETAFHTFNRPGTYTISLTVFDNRGGSGTTMQSIVVQ